jgi:pyruvate dehydrogenase E2 component (dihydrolipoamide acetyltransferase)
METVVMPKMSDMMEEGKVLTWLKKVGDQVSKGDVLAEVETEKVNIEINAYASGILREIVVPVGQSAAVGAPIAYIGTADEPLPVAAGSPTTTQASAAQPLAPPVTEQVVAAPAAVGAGSNGRIKASPLARRLAEEHHIDLSQVRGSGPDGRIVKEDVEAAIAGVPAAPAPPVPAASRAVVTTAADEIVPLSTMRRTIARRLQESAQTVPHFYLTMAMDATQLTGLRDQLNTALAQQSVPLKISYNDLIVLVVARTIELHPEINVSFEEDRIVRHKAINIGIAVALDEGLIVPVVRDANRRAIGDLASEIRRLSDAARAGKLKPEDIQGGTFTISNLGMLDVEQFTAIINPPESAILAVGAIVPTPVVVDRQVVVRDQVKMTLSSDHRAIDGAQAARFLRDVKRFIETPALLML